MFGPEWVPMIIWWALVLIWTAYFALRPSIASGTAKLKMLTADLERETNRLKSTGRITCVLCKRKTGSGLKTFPEFDHKPVCFDCQCKTGFFRRNHDADAARRWRQFTMPGKNLDDDRAKMAALYQRWACDYCSFPDNSPESTTCYRCSGKKSAPKLPLTLDEKLAATLASAQASVYESLALVNPLRLQVWLELNEIEQPEPVEVVDWESKAKELTADVTLKDAEIGYLQEELNNLTKDYEQLTKEKSPSGDAMAWANQQIMRLTEDNKKLMHQMPIARATRDVCKNCEDMK